MTHVRLRIVQFQTSNNGEFPFYTIPGPVTIEEVEPRTAGL